MHFLDITIILLSLGFIIFLSINEKVNKLFFTIFSFILLIVFSAYQILDLGKWHLTPVYIVFIVSIGYMQFKNPKKIIKISYIVISTMLISLSFGLVYALPIGEIPMPTGDYQIGNQYFIVEDNDRLELYTDDPNDTRRFAFNVWFPTDDTQDKNLSRWIGNQYITRGLAKSVGLPSFSLDHLVDIKSNSYSWTTISNQEEKYPVVIISHGWGGFMSLHTDIAEEFASRGYVVISIDHTYGSVATTFIDETVYQNKDALPSRDEPNFLDKATQLVNTYAKDVSKTIDFLEEKNEAETGFFSGKLDLDYIGLIGHSTGGGADVAVALDDDRITALIGLDAWVEPISTQEIDKGLDIPSLFIRSETWSEGENNIHLNLLIKNSINSMLFQIDGSTHADFTMAYMFSPLTSVIGFTGSLDYQYLLDMQKAVMVPFFEQHLKNDGAFDYTQLDYDELNKITVE